MMSLPNWLVEVDETGCVSCEGATLPGKHYCRECRIDLEDLEADRKIQDAKEGW